MKFDKNKNKKRKKENKKKPLHKLRRMSTTKGRPIIKMVKIFIFYNKLSHKFSLTVLVVVVVGENGR